MNPIKNKKDLEKQLLMKLEILLIAYLEKYSPSKQQLRTYLFKKIIKKKKIL